LKAMCSNAATIRSAARPSPYGFLHLPSPHGDRNRKETLDGEDDAIGVGADELQGPGV
jgi:hypothetical protein